MLLDLIKAVGTWKRASSMLSCSQAFAQAAVPPPTKKRYMYIMRRESCRGISCPKQPQATKQRNANAVRAFLLQSLFYASLLLLNSQLLNSQIAAGRHALWIWIGTFPFCARHCLQVCGDGQSFLARLWEARAWHCLQVCGDQQSFLARPAKARAKDCLQRIDCDSRCLFLPAWWAADSMK